MLEFGLKVLHLFCLKSDDFTSFQLCHNCLFRESSNVLLFL